MKIYNYQSKSLKSESVKSKPNKEKIKFSFKNWKIWAKNLPWNRIGTWIFRVSAAGVLLLAFLFIYYSRSLPDPTIPAPLN